MQAFASSISFSLSLSLSLSFSRCLFLALSAIASPGHVDVRGMLGAEDRRGQGGGGWAGGWEGVVVVGFGGVEGRGERGSREVLPESVVSARQMQYTSLGTWCSGITSASHAEGPGFKSQCVHCSQLAPIIA